MATRSPQPGDLALLVGQDGKHFLAKIVPGGELHTHAGIIAFDAVAAAGWGGRVLSHAGKTFSVLRPSMEEILRRLKRTTQIMYPKDIGYVLLKLSITPGARVVEAGSGSGGLTVALARYVTPGGHVYSYDVRPDHLAIARHNIELLGLQEAVTFGERDIETGIPERDVDAVFLDVREPWRCLDAVHDALCGGGFLGCLVPTLNQVVRLTEALDRRPFTEVEIAELMLRQYKPVPQRIRPLDRLTAHTGYLVFARAQFEAEPVEMSRERTIWRERDDRGDRDDGEDRGEKVARQDRDVPDDRRDGEDHPELADFPDRDDPGDLDASVDP